MGLSHSRLFIAPVVSCGYVGPDTFTQFVGDESLIGTGRGHRGEKPPHLGSEFAVALYGEVIGRGVPATLNLEASLD